MAVGKIAGIEGVSIGFGGADESVYRVVAADGSACRVSPAFYVTVTLPHPVYCYWEHAE
jgi:hypothetical protein